MLIEMSLVLVGFVLLIASITDVKSTEVPDWLTYGGIAAGIGLHLVVAVMEWSWRPLLSGGLGLLLFIVLGYIMYYAGQWGGGDSKAMMAVGALLGFEFAFDHVAVAFLINALFIGAIYGIGWMIYIAIKKRKKFLPYFAKMAHKKSYVIARYSSLSVLVVLGAASFFVADPILRTMLLMLAVFIPFIVYMMMLVKTVEKACMIRSAKPSELLEGDWIVKDVMAGKKRLAGPKDLGITKWQISEIKRLSKRRKIRILVKDGIPFVPSFLIAYIVTLLIGNPILFF